MNNLMAVHVLNTICELFEDVSCLRKLVLEVLQNPGGLDGLTEGRIGKRKHKESKEMQRDIPTYSRYFQDLLSFDAWPHSL